MGPYSLVRRDGRNLLPGLKVCLFTHLENSGTGYVFRRKRTSSSSPVLGSTAVRTKGAIFTRNCSEVVTRCRWRDSRRQLCTSFPRPTQLRQMDRLERSPCPNFRMQKDHPIGREKFVSLRLNFRRTRPKRSGSLSGARLLRPNAGLLSKRWQSSEEAGLRLQSYWGFRSAPCGTRSTNMKSAEKLCPHQTSIE